MGLVLTPSLDQTGAWSMATHGLGTRVGLDGVLGDLRRRGRRAAVRRTTGGQGFAWDRTDATTHHWWPQGLTTRADSGGPPLADQPHVLLAAWYRKDDGRADRAARVSVVDLGVGGRECSRPRYDHVLLVEADRDPVSKGARHGHVRVHAGGLAWWGDLLLVADTRHGLRIFDLRDVVRVEASPETHGCRFLLPQCGRWTASADGGDEPLRWSFCSIDRTDPEGPWLVAGEYAKAGTGARLARFPLPAEPAEVCAVEVLTTGLASMQGACRVHGTYVVSTSHGSRMRGHVHTGGAGGFRKHARALPIGPEDLSHEPLTGRVWTQTEYPRRRVVLSLPVPR